MKTHALKKLDKLPLALQDDIFSYYPAMKLGAKSAVVFYSRKLSELAAKIIKKSTNKEWIITAPPYFYLPSAANLLARQVYRNLKEIKIKIELCEPKLGEKHVSFNTQAEFDLYYDYSKNSLQKRISERDRLQNLLESCSLSNQLNNKSVIVINDINVTGTQQTYMQKAFDKFGVKSCDWLYIFYVDRTLGTKNPAIEHHINHSNIKSLESFIRIISDPDTHHTSRCISRLFSESCSNFAFIIHHLNKDQRRALLHKAQAEGRYSGKLFLEKMMLLNPNPKSVLSTGGQICMT